MLFELSFVGHYPGYIQHLVRFWCEQKLAGRLYIVVSPEFLQQHLDILNITSSYSAKNVDFVAINQEEQAAIRARESMINIPFSLASRSFEWHLIDKYASSLRATQCLIMSFDNYQLPMALRAKLPCPFSGIYFRPTFHYSDFDNYVPSWKERLQQWRKKFLLSRILTHPQFLTLFCLDPFVIKHIDKFHSHVRAVHLPEPVQTYNNFKPELESLRKSLGILRGRRVFLLFGVLKKYKGTHQLLESISMLPSTLCQKLCLLLIGPLGSGFEDKTRIQTRITEISQSLPVQIITHDRFVPDREIQSYFQIADVILTPYQRHIAMSAILVRAAAAQKPVLSSDYGLMGEIIRYWKLGLTCDSTFPSKIAEGLTKFLLEEPMSFCDRRQMELFANQNSAEKFASVIFQNLGYQINDCTQKLL
jgi:glycosyltransferase involved in cell wall biosynthesis